MAHGWTKCSLDGYYPSYIEPTRYSRLSSFGCFRFEPYWLRVDITFYDVIGDEIVPAKFCQGQHDPAEIPPNWPTKYDPHLKRFCRIPAKDPKSYVKQPCPKSLVYPFSTCSKKDILKNIDLKPKMFLCIFVSLFKIFQIVFIR